MSFIPFASSPWDEVTPGLWQGGHDWRDGQELRAAVVTDEFDLVISLYQRDGHGPDEIVQHVYYRIPDGTLTADELDRVGQLAVQAADAVEDGRQVLVRCQAGYNRSGLVVAKALIRMGHSPDRAIAMIRTARSPFALCNTNFVSYLGGGA